MSTCNNIRNINRCELLAVSTIIGIGSGIGVTIGILGVNAAVSTVFQLGNAAVGSVSWLWNKIQGTGATVNLEENIETSCNISTQLK